MKQRSRMKALRESVAKLPVPVSTERVDALLATISGAVEKHPDAPATAFAAVVRAHPEVKHDEPTILFMIGVAARKQARLARAGGRTGSGS